MDTILLTPSYSGRVGLLAETTGFCANRGLHLLEAHQVTDADWRAPGESVQLICEFGGACVPPPSHEKKETHGPLIVP